MKTKTVVFFCSGILFSLLGTSCSSISAEQELNTFRERANKSDNAMSEMEEQNLDDDLNKVERRDVDKIFEEERRETERTNDEIFSD